MVLRTEDSAFKGRAPSSDGGCDHARRGARDRGARVAADDRPAGRAARAAGSRRPAAPRCAPQSDWPDRARGCSIARRSTSSGALSAPDEAAPSPASTRRAFAAANKFASSTTLARRPPPHPRCQLASSWPRRVAAASGSPLRDRRRVPPTCLRDQCWRSRVASFRARCLPGRRWPCTRRRVACLATRFRPRERTIEVERLTKRTRARQLALMRAARSSTRHRPSQRTRTKKKRTRPTA